MPKSSSWKTRADKKTRHCLISLGLCRQGPAPSSDPRIARLAAQDVLTRLGEEMEAPRQRAVVPVSVKRTSWNPPKSAASRKNARRSVRYFDSRYIPSGREKWYLKNKGQDRVSPVEETVEKEDNGKTGCGSSGRSEYYEAKEVQQDEWEEDKWEEDTSEPFDLEDFPMPPKTVRHIPQGRNADCKAPSDTARLDFAYDGAADPRDTNSPAEHGGNKHESEEPRLLIPESPERVTSKTSAANRRGVSDPVVWESLRRSLAQQYHMSALSALSEHLNSSDTAQPSRTSSQRKCLDRFSRALERYADTTNAYGREPVFTPTPGTGPTLRTISPLVPYEAELKQAGLAVTSKQQEGSPAAAQILQHYKSSRREPYMPWEESNVAPAFTRIDTTYSEQLSAPILDTGDARQVEQTTNGDLQRPAVIEDGPKPKKNTKSTPFLSCRPEVSEEDRRVQEVQRSKSSRPVRREETPCSITRQKKVKPSKSSRLRRLYPTFEDPTYKRPVTQIIYRYPHPEPPTLPPPLPPQDADRLRKVKTFPPGTSPKKKTRPREPLFPVPHQGDVSPKTRSISPCKGPLKSENIPGASLAKAKSCRPIQEPTVAGPSKAAVARNLECGGQDVSHVPAPSKPHGIGQDMSFTAEELVRAYNTCRNVALGKRVAKRHRLSKEPVVKAVKAVPHDLEEDSLDAKPARHSTKASEPKVALAASKMTERQASKAPVRNMPRDRVRVPVREYLEGVDEGEFSIGDSLERYPPLPPRPKPRSKSTLKKDTSVVESLPTRAPTVRQPVPLESNHGSSIPKLPYTWKDTGSQSSLKRALEAAARPSTVQTPRDSLPDVQVTADETQRLLADLILPDEPNPLLRPRIPKRKSSARGSFRSGTSVLYLDTDDRGIRDADVLKGLHVAAAAACDEDVDAWIRSKTGLRLRRFLADLRAFEGLDGPEGVLAGPGDEDEQRDRRRRAEERRMRFRADKRNSRRLRKEADGKV